MQAYSVRLLRKALSAINENDEEVAVRRAESLMLDPGFWSRTDARDLVLAAERGRQRLALRARAEDLGFYEEALTDPDLEEEARTALLGLSRDAERALLDPAHADHPALITITAGAGGEDARDFAAMTLREIVLYAESLGFRAEVLDDTFEGQGLRDATIRISGSGAFQAFRGEAGKRRLVRKSPFGAGGRQTSFCGVSVVPELPETEVSVSNADLRFETYRDTGPGGQHRNTTDSAVRVTHIPTGISAKSAMRSQHENKRIALLTLMSRIAAVQKKANEAESASVRVGGGDAGFGGHVRTVVLDPYRLVRNEISGETTADADAYLNGGGIDVRAAFPFPE